MPPNESWRSSATVDISNSTRAVRKTTGRLLAVFSLGLALWLLATPIARVLVVRSEPLRADAMIVLSGAPVYAERIRHASSIYLQGHAPVVILTDDGLAGPWSRQQQKNPRSIERGRDMLLAAGVPASRIVLLPEIVTSTYKEAVAARHYVRRTGLKTLLVVTSPYHSRRALWAFRRVLEPEGVSVGIDPVSPGDLSPKPNSWWLTGRGWKSVGAEYVKWPYYLLMLR
jgi:uncharacterized SAM-binding protein YcdF (DUF218 family)